MVRSEFVKFRNSRGQTIVGIYDHVGPSGNRQPFIVIPPAFGEVKTDSLSLSYFLVMNGFRVIRYDGADHTGESDGDILHYTLEKGKDDLIDCINHIEREFGVNEVAVIAKSLAWRYALKAVSCDKRIRFLAGIGGIVDLQKTIRTVRQEDLVALVVNGGLKGRRLGEIFGFRVAPDFLETAVRYKYHDLKSTIRDFSKLKVPSVYLYAEKDVWIDIDDVRRIFNGKRRNTELHIIPNVLHQIDENPAAALDIFSRTVQICRKYFMCTCTERDKVAKPDVRTVALQNRKERDRLRSYELTRENEKEFWQKYLKKYAIINESADFRDYLDTLIDFSGEIRKDEVILDGGCGPGFLGSWILMRSRNEFPFYIGVDIIKPVLKKARTGHGRLLERMSRHGHGNRSLYGRLSYVCGDLDSPWDMTARSHICFKSNSFDRIFCSLLLSYVKDPVFVLKECSRMLRPGGKMIISTLKPHADLSQIYHNFVSGAGHNKDIRKAVELLNSAGMIKLKESQGHYQFFSEEQLTDLLKKAKFRNIRCCRTFGDQANLAVGVK